jgi:hypothetical protein
MIVPPAPVTRFCQWQKVVPPVLPAPLRDMALVDSSSCFLVEKKVTPVVRCQIDATPHTSIVPKPPP